MSSENNAPLSAAQWRRSEREKRRAAQDDAIIAYHCNEITRAAAPFDVDRAAIHDAIRAVMHRVGRYFSAVSRRGVALHEAGHFLAGHVEGAKPSSAWIKGSPWSRCGYSGEVESRPIHLRDADARADALLAWARTLIAGPVAEEFFHEGLVIHNIGELMLARAYVSRDALMTGRDRGEAWNRTVAQALTILIAREWEVREIAEMLEKRGKIRCDDRSVKKLLAQMSPLKGYDLAMLEHDDRAQNIMRSLKAVPDVLHEVRR
jgi:hypothetical protein